MKTSLLANVQGLFFEAMVSGGWAVGGKGIGISGMSDWRQIPYAPADCRGLRLVDRWGTDEAGQASGSILITQFEVPVWIMRFGGIAYEKSALPFLQTVLRQAYRQRTFEGGRGAAWATDNHHAYTNTWVGDFSKFRGDERIIDLERAEPAGQHTYWGGMLI